jgi:hypothetical protein
LTLRVQKLFVIRTLDGDEGTVRRVDGLGEVLVGPEVVAAQQAPQSSGEMKLLLDKKDIFIN